MEKEAGGGIRMGNTCKSMADSCQCMTKQPQYCKVISLQLIKINGKKKKESADFLSLVNNIAGLQLVIDIFLKVDEICYVNNVFCALKKIKESAFTEKKKKNLEINWV